MTTSKQTAPERIGPMACPASPTIQTPFHVLGFVPPKLANHIACRTQTANPTQPDATAVPAHSLLESLQAPLSTRFSRPMGAPSPRNPNKPKPLPRPQLRSIKIRNSGLPPSTFERVSGLEQSKIPSRKLGSFRQNAFLAPPWRGIFPQPKQIALLYSKSQQI